MNPQMYQSIKMMELPLVDLREKIAEELERNPALELLDDRSMVPLGDGEPAQREVEDYFEEGSDSGFQRQGPPDSFGNHRGLMEGVLTRPETLQQHLLWQLQLEPVDGELRSIASVLVQNLDDDGFHREPPETLFPKGDLPSAAPPRMAEAMELVRGLEPVGCCTADYREALKVQIAMLRGDPACMECPMDHLRLLDRGKLAAAAKKTPCGKENSVACFNMVKKLSPFPGRAFSATEVRFVVPDIQIARDGDGFSVILNNEVIPVLGINPFFKKLAPPPGGRGDTARKEAGEFARENVRQAKVFINSIAMRNHTLKLVVRALLDFQRPFFENGPRHLIPLTLGDLAAKVGIHLTTVSRIANGKYVRTEWGVFELRRFFTNSISGSGSSGSGYSKEGVKAIIRELLETEERSLSDHEISRILGERGIPLARRTVAKYRGELDLGSSYSRGVVAAAILEEK